MAIGLGRPKVREATGRGLREVADFPEPGRVMRAPDISQDRGSVAVTALVVYSAGAVSRLALRLLVLFTFADRRPVIRSGVGLQERRHLDHAAFW
jgi:hypothetical protein